VAYNEGNHTAVHKKVRPLSEKERERGNDCPTWRRRIAQNSLRSYVNGYKWTLPNNVARKQVSPHFYCTPDKVCYGVSHPRSHGRNLCEGVLKPNRYASWFRFDLHHGTRQRICNLSSKNVQNIRCPQGAYFHLSCVLKWDGGKAPPFPPFRLLVLRKCKS